MYTLKNYFRKSNISNQAFPRLNYISKYFFSDKKIKSIMPNKIVTPTKISLASPPQPNPTATPIPNNQQIADPSKFQKTPHQLNLERLMSQWPESIQNPTNEITQEIRDGFLELYKYHLGDKPYHKTDDLPGQLWIETLNATHGAMTTENISDTFTDFEGFLTDQQMAERFFVICASHQDFTKDFYKIVVPTIKKMLQKADRTSVHSVHLCTVAASRAFLGDNEFWEIIVTYLKLI